MTKKKVLVSGCNGHMGQIVCRLIEQSDLFEFQYGFDKEILEISNNCFTNLDDIPESDMPDIIIDFSAPEATRQLLPFAKEFNIPIVIATTGLSDYDIQAIIGVSNHIPVFQSANMSVEVCLIKNILASIAPKLRDSDIEISETHHNRKKDAPSGTAKMFADAIVDSLGESKAKCIYGRTGKREKGEIGISALRGGNIVGEHSIFFFGQYETLEIKHSALSRDLFAEGALKASEFLLKQGPGFYNMDDMISM